MDTPFFRFAVHVLRYAIGVKNSHHFIIQSEVKAKTIVTRTHTFSRASHQLLVSAKSFDWFTGLPVSLLIG